MLLVSDVVVVIVVHPLRIFIGALVVTLAMLLRLISCRFFIINIKT